MVGTTRRTCSASQIVSSSVMYDSSVASGTRYDRSATCTDGDSGLTSVTITDPGTPSAPNRRPKRLDEGDAARPGGEEHVEPFHEARSITMSAARNGAPAGRS